MPFLKPNVGNKLRVQRPSLPCRVILVGGPRYWPWFPAARGEGMGRQFSEPSPMVTGPSAHFLSFAAVQVSDPMSRNHGPPETWHKNGAGPRDLLLSVALNSVGKTQSWEAQMSSVISCAVIKTEKKIIAEAAALLVVGRDTS